MSTRLARPPMTPAEIAEAAIDLFLEFRDIHGCTEEAAKWAATGEVQEGCAAIDEVNVEQAEARP